MTDQSEDIRLQAARILSGDMQTQAQQIREAQGTPYGVQPLGRDPELWAWGFADKSVDVDALRAQGHSDADIVDLKFPLQQHLMQQAGLTFDEQKAYADRMTAKWLAMQARGETPKPPERPPQQLTPGG